MEPEFSRRRLAVCILIAVVRSLAIFAVAHRRPWESPTTRAYRLCSECGLTAGELDDLVDSARLSTLNRKQRIELFYSRYETRAEAGRASELCGGCVEAGVDAAGQ